MLQGWQDQYALSAQSKQHLDKTNYNNGKWWNLFIYVFIILAIVCTNDLLIYS